MSPDRVSLSLREQSESVRALRGRRRSPRSQLLPKAAPEVFLVPLAVRETGAGGLGPTDAAAVQAPVHFWLVKAKHLHGNVHRNKRA